MKFNKFIDLYKTLRVLYKSAFTGILFWSLLTLSIAFYSPIQLLLEKNIFDQAVDNIKFGWSKEANRKLLILISLFFIYSLLTFASSKLINYLNQHISIRVSKYLRTNMIEKLKNIPYILFESNQFYNSIQAAGSEINGDNIIKIYRNVINLIQNSINIIPVGILLSRFSLWAIFISVAFCIPGFLHQSWFGKENWRFVTSQIPIVRKMEYLFNMITSNNSVKDNKLLDLPQFYMKRREDLFNKYYDELEKFNRVHCWRGVCLALLHSLGTVGIIGWVYFSALNSGITIGEAVLYVGAAQRLYNGIQALIYCYGEFVQSVSMSDNIIGFLEKDYEEESINEEQVNSIEHIESIVFEDVYFRYPCSEKEVLSGVSFSISKAEKVALVGENGSGKTTIIKLLLGLYKPTRGRILINNINIKNISKENLYMLFTGCFQDFFTYSLTVRENIGFGNLDKINIDDEILNAAEKSGFDKVIHSMEKGIDHYINREFSKDGFVLSGGQSQKLALARAFISESDLIILDEPSAALDIKTEYEIFEKTLKLIEKKTVIFITHRLANVISANKILLIKEGIVCEYGTHSELMKSNGEYSKLFKLQAERYVSA